MLTQVAQDTQIVVFACLGTKPDHFSSSERSIWLSIVALALGRKTVSQVITDAGHDVNTTLQQSHWSHTWFEINRQLHPTPNQQGSSGDPQTRFKRSTRKRKQQPSAPPPPQRSKKGRRSTRPERVDPTPATQRSDHSIDYPRSPEPQCPIDDVESLRCVEMETQDSCVSANMTGFVQEELSLEMHFADPSAQPHRHMLQSPDGLTVSLSRHQVFHLAHIVVQGSRYHRWLAMWRKVILDGQEGPQPKYHQPSATSRSSIFVVDHPSLPQAELQAIFSQRHILIRQAPLKPSSFGLTELSELCDVASPIERYGESYPPLGSHWEADDHGFFDKTFPSTTIQQATQRRKRKVFKTCGRSFTTALYASPTSRSHPSPSGRGIAHSRVFSKRQSSAIGDGV